MTARNADLDFAFAQAAADVFQRSFLESLPPDVRDQVVQADQRRQLQREFDAVLDHARKTLLRWHDDRKPLPPTKT